MTRPEQLSKFEEDADAEYLRQEVPAATAQALDGVQRVSSIVRAMKAFGHPDQGQPRRTDIEESVRSTLVVARNETKYVADVVTDFGTVPHVLCVTSDINQVILNLLVNAAHAVGEKVAGTSERGTITVGTRHDPETGTVTLSFADTGTGIPAEVRERIFDPFFTTKEVGRGTGQGLALVRSIVQRHGGSVEFSSVVGEGTTFEVHLPVEGPSAASPSNGSDQGDGTPAMAGSHRSQDVV